jgi:hypothetical protein
MAKMARLSGFEVWHSHLDVESIISAAPDKPARSRVKQTAAKARQGTILQAPVQAHIRDGRRVIVEDPPVVVRLTAPLISSSGAPTGRPDDRTPGACPAAPVRPSGHRERRCHSETLRTYVSADLNAKTAAKRLAIHANTVHYRLGRISERTGCDLRNLADIVDLMVAIRLASPQTAQGDGDQASSVPSRRPRRQRPPEAPSSW